MIDTKVHISNSLVKKQFEELDTNNLKQRFYYGIVSDVNTEDDNSSLHLSIQKRVFYVSINPVEAESVEDCLVIVRINNGILEKTKYYSGDGWSYKESAEDTAISISQFLNNFENMTSYVEDSQVILTTYDSSINIRAEGKKISSFASSRLGISTGSVIFKDGNSLTLNKEAYFDFEWTSNYSDGDIFRVLIRYKLVDTEKDFDIFGEEQVKRVDFDSLENSIVVEVASGEEPADNEICIGILKLEKGIIKIVDTNGHHFPYSRPWFSPKDVMHRSYKGSSKVTKSNPHGIGYNDIDSNNTLHNRLMDNGIIVSSPVSVQDCSGILIQETLYANNIIIDDNDSFNLENKSRYYKMSYCPNQILGIYDLEGNEIYLEHIKQTPYLIVEDVRDIKIVYLATKTAYSNIDYTQGIKLDSVSDTDVLFSEGKCIKNLDNDVSVFHKNINGFYVIDIDKKGVVKSNPLVQVNNSLDVDSSDFLGVDSNSRLKVYLYDTDSKFSLKCPDTGVSYVAPKEYNIVKTNASYIENANGNHTLYKESFVSPSFNTFKEEKSEYITINLSKNVQDINENKERISINDFGSLKYGKTYKGNVNGSNKKLLKIKALIKARNVSNNVSVYFNFNGYSVTANLNKGPISSFTLEKEVLEIGIFTNTFEVRFASDSTAFITKFELELVYDTIENRYFISQEEDDGEVVTRLLYDPYKIYPADEVITSGSTVLIKRSCIEYGYKSEDKSDTTVYSISDSFPIVTNLKTNSNFKVELSIYGESNGESIVEDMVFDYDFREQEPFNYKLSNNSFDKITKYTISSKNAQGNILILSYPVSNYHNPCNVSTMHFREDNTITKYQDARICVPKIEDSIISRDDIECLENSYDILDNF